MSALRVTGRGWGVLVGAALAGVAGWAAGSYVVAAGGVFAAAVVALSAMRGLVRRRRCRIERVRQATTARAGEPITAAAAIVQAGPGAPVGLVSMLTPAWSSDARASGRTAVVRLGRGSTEVAQSFTAARRGVYTWPAPELELPDLFGTVHGVVVGNPGGATVVFPEVIPLLDARMPVPTAMHSVVEEGEAPARIPLGADDGNPVPRYYRSGDDMRRMHWPATARTGEPMVRSEQGQPVRRAAVLLDCRADSHPAPEGFERAVVAAASIGVWFIDRGWQVSLQTSGGVPLTTPGWQHGLLGRVQLLTALASVDLNTEGNAQVLAEPTDAVCAILGTGALEHSSTTPWLVLRTCRPPSAAQDHEGAITLLWDGTTDLGPLWASAVSARSEVS